MGKQWDRGDYCTLAPDKPFGVDISNDCFKHDVAYLKESDSYVRLDADLKLREDIVKKFNKADKKVLGFIVSQIYYIFVRFFGRLYWKK